MRTLVWRLRPIEVEELGLESAVRSLAEKIRQRHRIPVEVHVIGLDGLGAAVETAIFRVIQEAVTNAVRHADAETISIVIARRGGLVSTVVEDDGRGFGADTRGVVVPTESGVGILGMHERAASLNGRLTLESRPGRGTIVRLDVPVTNSGAV
jgi:signal transduction histidine kinase